MILTFICLLFYPLAIKFKRGGYYNWWKILAFIIGMLDIIANYTEWWIVFGKPPEGCTTISKRLKWMQTNASTESQRKLAETVYIFLDACEDDGKH